MSRVAARFHNQIVAIGPFEVDEYGGLVSDNPIEIKCEFKTGDKIVKDSSGTEFMPDYVIYTTDSRVADMRRAAVYMSAIADLTGDVRAKLVRAVIYMPALGGMGGGDYVIYV